MTHPHHEIPDGWEVGEEGGMSIPLTCTTCWARVGPEYLDKHTAWHKEQEYRYHLAAMGI